MVIKIPATETEKFAINLTFTDGQEVEVTFEFQKDHALSAIQAIGQIEENAGTYVQNLAYHFRNDPSVAESLKAAGLGFDDDEEDY